jgi:hypothetical protein
MVEVFGIALTPLSKLHSREFGIALTENGAQIASYKAIWRLIKSIIKVIKKSFLFKRKMWIKNLL